VTQEALKLALEALERSVATCFDQYAHQQVMSQPDHFINKAITALRLAIDVQNMASESTYKEALAQPEQEPVAWVQDVEFEQSPEFAFSWVKTKLHDKPLYTLPPQRTEQEPVADAYTLADKVRKALDRQSCPDAFMRTAWEAVVNNYPPQRTWVDLTDEQLRTEFGKLYPNDIGILELAENNRDFAVEAIGARHHWAAFQAGARAAEAKLKEKK
jgi:hypothetical protein